METQFSKQDKSIEEGVQSLREMAVDTSKMAYVLKPPPRRSMMLPVGLATAVACAVGAAVLLAPAKATANPLQKVQEAVSKQDRVYEKILQRGDDGAWEIRLETWKDGKNQGVKWGAAGDGYQYVIQDGKRYEKSPGDITVKVSSADDFVDMSFPSQAIHDVLARDGMQFLGIQRSQTKDGRACDIYRLNYQNEPNDLIYYVDPKTDLPFLQEVVDKSGKVLNLVEIDFDAEIMIVMPDSEGNGGDLFIVKGAEIEIEGQRVKILTP